MLKGPLFQPGVAFPSRAHALTAIAEDCEVRGTRYKILNGKNGLNGNALMVACAKPQAKHKVNEQKEKPSADVRGDGEVKERGKKGFVKLTYNERLDRVGNVVKQHHYDVSRGDACSYLVTLVRSGSVTGKLRASAFTMGQAGSVDNPVLMDMEEQMTGFLQATVEGDPPPAAECHLMGILNAVDPSSESEAEASAILPSHEEDRASAVPRSDKDDSAASVPPLQTIQGGNTTGGGKGYYVVKEMRGCNSCCSWGANMVREDEADVVYRSNITAYSRNMLAAAILPWYCQQVAHGNTSPSTQSVLQQLQLYIRAPLVTGGGHADSSGASSMARACANICKQQSEDARANSMQLIQGLFSLLNKKGYPAKIYVADGNQEQQRSRLSCDRPQQ